MNATVLARGPSLLRCTPDDVLEGPVLAINAAIEHRCIPAQFWVCLDEPSNAYPAIADNPEPWRPNPAPVLVTRQGAAAYWARVPTAGMFVHDGRYKWSIILALWHAQKIGATRVRVLGADMEGRNYAYGPPGGFVPHERWKAERAALARAGTELANCGVAVEFGRGD